MNVFLSDDAPPLKFEIWAVKALADAIFRAQSEGLEDDENGRIEYRGLFNGYFIYFCSIFLLLCLK